MADIDELIRQNMMAFAKQERQKSLKEMARRVMTEVTLFGKVRERCNSCDTAENIMPSHEVLDPICRNCAAGVAHDINNAIMVFDHLQREEGKR